MITREFNLYLHAGHSIPLVINVNQYDRGEQWLFALFNSDGTQYTPSSGAIVGIKSDNLGIINTGSVDNQGRVVINETQQMTAAVGKAVFELLIDDQSHGTANFIVLVEPKPGDNADLSESDLSLIQQAIDGTSAAAIAQGVSDWMDENLTPTTPVVDASLTVQGAAADAKKTGDEISELKSQIAQSGGLKDSIKNALLQIASKVAYIDDDGQDYYDALYSAFYNVEVLSISAVYNTGGVEIFDTASLDDLKQYLTVTANYDNGTSGTVTGYMLSGSMTSGIQEITVSYGGKSATFNATIYHDYATKGFTNWGGSNGQTKTADMITMKPTQANADAWKCWTADKVNRWSNLKGKRMKARLTLDSPDWVGEVSTASPVNLVMLGFAAFSSNSKTTLTDRVGVASLPYFDLIDVTTPTVYELEFTVETTNTNVTDSYYCGIYFYQASANTVHVTNAQLIEVFDYEGTEE